MMHAKPDLRVFLKWMIAGSGSVIADVIRLLRMKIGLNSFLIGCSICGIIFAGIFYCVSFVIDLTTDEYIDISGKQARAMIFAWPQNVNASEIDRVSIKTEYQRDCYSLCYRFDTSKTVATKWQHAVHLEKQNRPLEFMDSVHEGYEGVNRVISGPPSFSPISTVPGWWNPPAIPFRSSELMVWPADSSPGLAFAIYSAYDPATGVLWVYSFGASTDQLWNKGKLPAGEGETFSGRPRQKRQPTG